jgi:LysR family transcriptional regulator (chromosome initiation inhibitor)
MVIIVNPLLSAFEKVAKLGTAHAAAKDLHLTQTAITKRIQLLETELSTTLFLRSRRGMTLTESGKALMQLCKASRELEGQFIAQLQGEKRQAVSLTIAGPTSAISTRISQQCEGLYSKYSYLQLHLQSDDHSDLIEKLRRGEADFAVVPPGEVPNEMDSKLIKPDRYLLVASPRWAERRLKNILETERVIDFYSSDKTTERYLRSFGLHDLVRQPRLFVNENEALLRFFKAGIGFGTLTESVARPHLDSGELITLNRGHAMEDPLALAWYPRSQKADYFEEIVRSVR